MKGGIKFCERVWNLSKLYFALQYSLLEEKKSNYRVFLNSKESETEILRCILWFWDHFSQKLFPKMSRNRITFFRPQPHQNWSHLAEEKRYKLSLRVNKKYLLENAQFTRKTNNLISQILQYSCLLPRQNNKVLF